MKTITVQDYLDLREKFKKYCETAEQHEFLKLFVIQKMLDQEIKSITEKGVVEDQEDARDMFRVVLKKIGEDITDYIEE